MTIKQRIIDYFKANPRSTAKECAAALGITRAQAHHHIHRTVEHLVKVGMRGSGKGAEALYAYVEPEKEPVFIGDPFGARVALDNWIQRSYVTCRQ